MIRKPLLLFLLAVTGLAISRGVGNSTHREQQDLPNRPPPEVASWQTVDDFPTSIAVFETVFWDPRDTESLRELIRQTPLVRGKSVLEIGTGTGVLALCCLKAGARKVVATDINPAAARNARYNARLLKVADRLEVRLVPPDEPAAYSVIGESERFDLIIANPPWEDRIPLSIDEYALYDHNFELLESLLVGLEDHLTAGGTALLAYGCKDAIGRLQELAHRYQLDVRVLDTRELAELPDVFLPGMLLEVTPRPSRSTAYP